MSSLDDSPNDEPAEPADAPDATDRPDTPDNRTFSSWAEASKHFVLAPENYRFIEHICDYIGIERLVPIDTNSYLKAIRRDGGPDIRIHPGFTNGFVSQEEARSASGSDSNAWKSDRKPGQLWGVHHPVNQIGQGSGGPARQQRDYGLCPHHNLKLPASGVCEC